MHLICSLFYFDDIQPAPFVWGHFCSRAVTDECHRSTKLLSEAPSTLLIAKVILPPSCLPHTSPSGTSQKDGPSIIICVAVLVLFKETLCIVESQHSQEKSEWIIRTKVCIRALAHTHTQTLAAVSRAASLPLRPAPEPVAASRGQHRPTISKFLLRGRSTENAQVR